MSESKLVNDKKFVYCLQDEKTCEIEFLKDKPRKRHDSYCWDNKCIYLIWYKRTNGKSER